MSLSTTHQVASSSVALRAIDAVDRAHARAAMVIHNVRNEVLSSVDRGLERAEQLAHSAIERARKGVKRVDVASADVVNRAQGVVGQAIEKARHARENAAS